MPKTKGIIEKGIYKSLSDRFQTTGLVNGKKVFRSFDSLQEAREFRKTIPPRGQKVKTIKAKEK